RFFPQRQVGDAAISIGLAQTTVQTQGLVKARYGFIEFAGFAKRATFGVVLLRLLFCCGAAGTSAEQLLKKVHGECYGLTDVIQRKGAPDSSDRTSHLSFAWNSKRSKIRL